MMSGDDKTYMVNECFYSLQGEGMRAGTANVFIRFTGCNLQCSMEAGPKSPGMFDCDTEFASGRKVTLDELWQWVRESISISTGGNLQPNQNEWPGWIILTGGEPGLQVDQQLCDFLHSKMCKLAIETNGTIELPWVEVLKPGICLPPGASRPGEHAFTKQYLLDWISLSPKVAEHALKQRFANELKYVRGYGQGIPKPAATAEHYLISPVFDGMRVDQRTLDWCIRLVLENPEWRLSVQQHKMLKVR